MATGTEVRKGGQLQVPIASQNLQPYCRLVRDFWLGCATNHEGFSIHHTSGKNGAGVKKKIRFWVRILISGIKAVLNGRVHLLFATFINHDTTPALTAHVN